MTDPRYYVIERNKIKELFRDNGIPVTRDPQEVARKASVLLDICGMSIYELARRAKVTPACIQNLFNERTAKSVHIKTAVGVDLAYDRVSRIFRET
jgi:ribosome-interacting GTPase 1